MLRFLLCLLTALPLVAAPATSAEIEILQHRPLGFDEIAQGRCTLRLTGSIAPGDAERLAAAIEGDEIVIMLMPELFVNFPNGMPRGHSLCLDSPGGSFTAGIDLAKLLIAEGIATVIEPESSCLSACAVAFMAGSMGSSNSSGGGRMPYRVMDVTSQLGFHAPYIPFDKLGKSIPPALAEESFRTALRTMVLITEALQGRDLFAPTGRFPKPLLLAMLGTYGADRFSYVDTIDEVGLYDIRLTGLPEIATDEGSWALLCGNVTGWFRGIPARDWASDLLSWGYEVRRLEEGPDPDLPLPEDLLLVDYDYDSATGRPEPSAFLRQVESRHESCTIYANAGPGDAFSVYFLENDQEPKLGLRPIGLWATLPRYVHLRDLAGATEIPTDRFRTLSDEAQRALRLDPVTPVPAFSPGQLWAFSAPQDYEAAPDFDLIDLRPDGTATLARDWWETEIIAEGLPYRIEGTRLCIEARAAFCLSPAGPGHLRLSGTGTELDWPVAYIRPSPAAPATP